MLKCLSLFRNDILKSKAFVTAFSTVNHEYDHISNVKLEKLFINEKFEKKDYEVIELLFLRIFQIHHQD